MIRNNDADEILSRINERLEIGMIDALKRYLYPHDEYNTLNDKLDEIIENTSELKYDHDMLIYPSKNKTDEVYPDFLCICRDETRLSTAFSLICVLRPPTVGGALSSGRGAVMERSAGGDHRPIISYIYLSSFRFIITV